jgi:hypothetical protein
MKLCVIDGQGGGFGRHIINQLRDGFASDLEIIALGTNAIATAQMLKAGANRGASGENAIVHTATKVAAILGPIGIIMPHAMMGEVTPKMAAAVAESPARKFLIPLSQDNITIAGVQALPLPRLVETMLTEALRPFIERLSRR